MCQLSISGPSGAYSLCNAVHIGQGRLLSAAHCFPEGKNTITHGILLASCGDQELMDFSNLSKTSDLPEGTLGEDISLLEFSPELKEAWIAPTSYPALYFEGGQLKSGVECEILAFRGRYPSKTLKRIKVDQSMSLRVLNNRTNEPVQIQMKLKSGGGLIAGTNVKEGDSGGALICRYSKKAPHELVGIIMTYGTDQVSKIIVQNTFSPVFGPGAKKILLPKSI
jgi:hypothetical protein